MTQHETPSPRRAWLKKAFVISVAAATLPKLAFGDSKAAKAAVHYQDHPVPGKMCGMCRFFIAHGATSPGKGMMGSGMSGMKACQDGSCQVVAGEISPMGYCTLYSPLA